MNALKRKRRNKSFVLLLITFLSLNFHQHCFAQEKTARVAFYNVENLFDLEHDTGKNDEEFLTGGMRYWTYKRLKLKLKRIYQVLMAMGEWSPPAVVGFCEIENQHVLEMLLHQTPLSKMGYKFIHKDSPDRRGIDVALIYNQALFEPAYYEAVPVLNPQDQAFKTRDILYVKGRLLHEEVHFFVNHWPSKYGGVAETKSLRALAAETLKHFTDSLFMDDGNAKILIMGDFNDTPTDESVLHSLQALPPQNDTINTTLYNLSFSMAQKGEGSNKHEAYWDLIDQMIVSGAFFGSDGLSISKDAFQLFKADFLLENDEKYLGLKPFRTYVGYKYHNGFSDHLPVYVDVKINE